MSSDPLGVIVTRRDVRLPRKDALEMGRKRELQSSLFAERTDEAGRSDLFCEL
jgi:hypothetical protein